MDTQTVLTIGLAILSLYLAYRNYVMATHKETRQESAELTEVKVTLDQVMSMLRDLQKDVRTSNADFRVLLERVVVAEQKLSEAFTRIEKLEEKDGKLSKQ